MCFRFVFGRSATTSTRIITRSSDLKKTVNWDKELSTKVQNDTLTKIKHFYSSILLNNFIEYGQSKTKKLQTESNKDQKKQTQRLPSNEKASKVIHPKCLIFNIYKHKRTRKTAKCAVDCGNFELISTFFCFALKCTLKKKINIYIRWDCSNERI